MPISTAIWRWVATLGPSSPDCFGLDLAMTGAMRAGLKLLLKAGFSIGLMAFLLTRIDAGQVLAGLASADPLWLGAALLAAIAAWCVNTWKWQRLLSLSGHSQPYPYLLGLNFVGMFYSIVLPGQISGEVMKGIRLARRGTGASVAALSIAFDRFTGLAALGAMGLGGLLLAPRVPASEALLWLLWPLWLWLLVPSSSRRGTSPRATWLGCLIFGRTHPGLLRRLCCRVWCFKCWSPLPTTAQRALWGWRCRRRR
jgi:hypothetical protein